jgi:sulfite exporter TauE/SafE
MAFAAEGAPTPNTVNSSVARLITTILSILIAILGLLMIAGAVWSLVHLWNQRKLIRISNEILRDCDWNDLWRLCHVGHLRRPYTYCLSSL